MAKFDRTKIEFDSADGYCPWWAEIKYSPEGERLYLTRESYGRTMEEALFNVVHEIAKGINAQR